MGHEARLNARLHWHRVTNELVTTFAHKDCPLCGGDGRRIDDSGAHQVCPCAAMMFLSEYDGRLRRRSEQGRQWLEYRSLAAVAA